MTPKGVLQAITHNHSNLECKIPAKKQQFTLKSFEKEIKHFPYLQSDKVIMGITCSCFGGSNAKKHTVTKKQVDVWTLREHKLKYEEYLVLKMRLDFIYDFCVI